MIRVVRLWREGCIVIEVEADAKIAGEWVIWTWTSQWETGGFTY